MGDSIEKAMRSEWEERLAHDAERMGLDERAWLRLNDLSLTEPVAQAVVAKLRDHHLYSSESIAAALSSLLCDVVDHTISQRERIQELALAAPAPPLFVVVPKGGDYG